MFCKFGSLFYSAFGSNFESINRNRPDSFNMSPFCYAVDIAPEIH